MNKQELHPVTELLLKRMESHPEEFILGDRAYHNYSREGKLNRIYNAALDHAPERDKQLLEATRSKLELDALHHELMDELLNGEERRARDEEVERQKAFAAAQMSNQIYAPGQLGAASINQYASQLQNYQNYQNAGHGSLLGGGRLTGTSGSVAIVDEAEDLSTTLSKLKKFVRK